MTRVALLGRLAKRYALRHKGQTIRALLGLLVATTVLTVGLGLGESIAGSLEDEALRRYGPIDVVVRSARPFPTTLVATLGNAASVTGVPSFNLIGAVMDKDSGRAEAFATIRGMSPQEGQQFGPLSAEDGSTIAEPRTGEVVLSLDLAERLDARVGHAVRLRAAPPDFEPDASVSPVQLVGATGVQGNVLPSHVITAREGALALAAEVSWSTEAGEVTITATSPGGIDFANKSATSPTRLIVEGPLEEGDWRIAVSSAVPTVYTGGAAIVYPPESLAAATVVLEARVVGIAAEDARAAITGRPAALVPIADLQRAFGQPGNATNAYYHVPTDPFAAVAAMDRAFPEANESGFILRAEKAEVIAAARENGAEITGFLLAMGGFTLLAAVLLAFTLFSALVEERRSELGIMRALGVTRGEAAVMMTLEGGLYAGAAALLGLLLGFVFLVVGIAALGNISASEGGPEFALHMSPLTMAIALGNGTGLPLATIALGSLRFARLDPARAIRGVPDDPKAGRKAGRVIALVLVVLGALLSFGPIVRLVGLPILVAGLAAFAWSLGWRRVTLALAGGGIALVVYTLYTFTAWPADAGELDPLVSLSRAAILALGASALAVASVRPYQIIANWLAKGRAKRPAFVAFRYLVARRRPAGLTMAMISVVVVIVTVMGTLFSVFSGTIPENEGGYTVLGESSVPVDDFPRALPADVESQIERADFLPRHSAYRRPTVEINGEPVEVTFGFRQFLGVTDGFAAANQYAISQRAPQYAADADVWRAAARGDAIIVPNWLSDGYSFSVGDRLVLDHPASGAKEYVVGGIIDNEVSFSPAVSAADVRAMGFPATTAIYVRMNEGGNPDDVAHRLTALYAEDGVTFTSFPEEVARFTSQIQVLVLVFEAFIALGLFVGLAATGFLASRAVHERIRDIGTLRALGFEEADVRRAFMLESTTTAGVGLVIGTTVGLVVAGSIWWREVRDSGAAFRPPWLLMATFAVAVLGLAALASRGPAKRAARLAPAIAVRHTE